VTGHSISCLQSRGPSSLALLSRCTFTEAVCFHDVAINAMRTSLGRAYYFVCPKSREEHPHVQAFRSWIKQEVAALDWKQVKGAGGLRPRVPASRRTAALHRPAKQF
jgi:hypothetical protein